MTDLEKLISWQAAAGSGVKDGAVVSEARHNQPGRLGLIIPAAQFHGIPKGRIALELACTLCIECTAL